MFLATLTSPYTKNHSKKSKYFLIHWYSLDSTSAQVLEFNVLNIAQVLDENKLNMNFYSSKQWQLAVTANIGLMASYCTKPSHLKGFLH